VKDWSLILLFSALWLVSSNAAAAHCNVHRERNLMLMLTGLEAVERHHIFVCGMINMETLGFFQPCMALDFDYDSCIQITERIRLES